jgi:tetratricopeptide (TPR) repeat protein
VAADAAAQKAIALEPNLAAGYVVRDMIAEAQGQDGNALQLGRQAIAVEPGSGSAHVALAKQLEATIPDESRAQFNEAVRVEPGNAQAYVDEGDFLLLVNNVPAALAAYRMDGVLQPTSAASKLRAADAYRAIGDNTTANQLLQSVVATTPNQPPTQASLTYRHVGDLYVRLQEPFDAISPYYKAKDLNPTGVENYVALSHALLLLQRTNEAITVANEAVNNNPSSAAALVLAGETYGSLGQTSQATSYYSRALQVDPTYSKAYFAFAKAVDPHHTNSAQGIALWQEGLVQNPSKDFNAYLGLVRVYGTHRAWLATQTYGLETQSSDPLWPTLSLGASYQVAAQLQSAVDAYDLAQQLAPDFMQLYCERGVLDERLGHYDEARHLLGICIDLSGGPQTVASARLSLQVILRNGIFVHVDSPSNGATVSGIVSVRGTALDLNFQYYRLDYRPAGTTTWYGIPSVVKQPVENGLLGKWDTRALPPGDYDVRLVVVDQAGQFSVPMQVTIHVK